MNTFSTISENQHYLPFSYYIKTSSRPVYMKLLKFTVSTKLDYHPAEIWVEKYTSILTPNQQKEMMKSILVEGAEATPEVPVRYTVSLWKLPGLHSIAF